MSLDLSNKLSIDFPDLSECDFIEVLNCSSNTFDDLPIIYLPISLIVLNCSMVFLETLPDLSKLRNLKKLNCSYNRLKELPKLPTSLRLLDCSYNYLTKLENLPLLFSLNCSCNNLIELPDLPDLSIFGNIFENIYIKIKCYDKIFRSYPCNILPYRSLTRICINKTNKILYKFRFIFYSMKFRNKFRKILWEKIRLPKIKDSFHPNNLKQILNNIGDEKDFDPDNWI